MHFSIAHDFCSMPSWILKKGKGLNQWDNHNANRVRTSSQVPKHLLDSRSKASVPLFPAGGNPKEIPFTTKDLARERRRKTKNKPRTKRKGGERRQEGKRKEERGKG